MSGNDRRATNQAYIEISMPAFASLILKSVAMSESRPMGMNSDVLKMKAERARAIRGNHSLIVVRLAGVCMIGIRVSENRESRMDFASSGSLRERPLVWESGRTGKYVE